MVTKVTAKGQVTIPKRVRDKLGLRPGSTVEFVLAEDGRVMLVNDTAPPQPGRFRRFLGSAGPGPTTDELMALLRGES